jgi:hypothetical protein
VFDADRLGAPEPARERRLADRITLTWAGIAGRSTLLANPIVALIIAEYIAASAGGELRPAAFERPFSCGRGS